MVGFFYDERSTYHDTIVHRVFSQLKRNGCKADFERSLMPGTRTDTFGYNKHEHTWYLCEIKVNWNDALKAIAQVGGYVHGFKNSKIYSELGGDIIPVIAIPKRVYDELTKHSPEKWDGYRASCRTANIALWIVGQSVIQQIQGPKPRAIKTTTKTTKAKPSTKTAKTKPVTKTAKAKPTTNIVKVKATTKKAKTKTVSKKV